MWYLFASTHNPIFAETNNILICCHKIQGHLIRIGVISKMIYYSNVKYFRESVTYIVGFKKQKITLKTWDSSIINKLNQRYLVNRMHIPYGAPMVGGADWNNFLYFLIFYQSTRRYHTPRLSVFAQWNMV
jgi:hypothetical protein